MPVHTVANIKIKTASAEHFSLQLSPTPRLPLKKKIRQSCKGLAREKSPAEVRQWTWKKKLLQAEKVPSLYHFSNGPSVPSQTDGHRPEFLDTSGSTFLYATIMIIVANEKVLFSSATCLKIRKKNIIILGCVYYFDVKLSNESFTENENSRLRQFLLESEKN